MSCYFVCYMDVVSTVVGGKIWANRTAEQRPQSIKPRKVFFLFPRELLRCIIYDDVCVIQLLASYSICDTYTGKR
jgi:hypothetical protein